MDSLLVSTEVVCSWKTNKFRILLNGEIVKTGFTVCRMYETDIPYGGYTFTVKISGHETDLLLDGIPVDWYSEGNRREQTMILAGALDQENSVPTTTNPGYKGLSENPSVALDTQISVAESYKPTKPLLY
jgi:hypothetical protein